MLVTDERGAKYPGLFKDVPVHILPAGRLGGGPIGLLKAVRSVLKGRRQARALYRSIAPMLSSASAAILLFRPCLRQARQMCRPSSMNRMPCLEGSIAGSRAARKPLPQAMARLSD
jgi:hypothetical protein